MNTTKTKFNKRGIHAHCKITKEKLKNTDIELTNFIFQPGANVYVFSYHINGILKHTFVDSGDFIYRNQFLDLLHENAIDPSRIENIIITHRHRDHCGLADMLAGESDATIMVHPGFRDFAEGRLRKEETWWLHGFDPTRLNQYRIQYLTYDQERGPKDISGLAFPRLGKSIDMGNNVRLEILACPESPIRHSPDQLVVLYRPFNRLEIREKVRRPLQRPSQKPFLPTDDMIFAGDLWLMESPIFDIPFFQRLPRIIFMKYLHLKSWISGNGLPRLNAREQDAEAKEALKWDFSLIRVKPGHGEEFIGSRLIPQSLLADRDILERLGHSLDSNKALLKREEIVPKVIRLQEEAYVRFIEELDLWEGWGYTADEITELLTRIYHEQKGGRGSVKQDRQERRQRLKKILLRLKNDQEAPQKLREFVNAFSC
jgi:hypothetical protein